MRLQFSLCLLFTSMLMAQESSSFNAIPNAPDTAVSGNVIARMIQGLGYRYHWATKDLREEDLAYRPSEGASSAYETLEHIYGLCEIIANTAASKPSKRPSTSVPQNYLSLRQATLAQLEQAEQLFLGKTADEVGRIEVVFDRNGKMYTYPVWNLLNGPLSDAIYHTGQLVSFRRTTGNPILKGVNVFLGKTNY